MTKVAALVGPTAVGKTEVSLDVAKALDAEIVSVDSMQIYRGMDVGTAKPTDVQRDRVPHHLIDALDPTYDLTVSEFQQLARAAIDDVSGRGRLPLLVGGSGLYYRAVVDDLVFPPRAEEIRERLEEEAERDGPGALYERLKELDPTAAARVEPANARRTIRALEAIELTGRPFSDNDTWDRYESIHDLATVGLTRARDELYARIVERVDDMLARGLVEEAKKIGEQGMSRTARQALGYRQILDDPEAPPERIRDEIAGATKRFARRQESWFRADPRVRWVNAAEPGCADAVEASLRRSLRLT